MRISVELTLTPLNNEYKSDIVYFINELRSSKFKLIETPLSTQIYGDYDELMPFLNATIKEIFKKTEHSMIHMKIINSDRSDYVADF